jgi:hypothetical protein
MHKISRLVAVLPTERPEITKGKFSGGKKMNRQHINGQL